LLLLVEDVKEYWEQVCIELTGDDQSQVGEVKVKEMPGPSGDYQASTSSPNPPCNPGLYNV
jgi:hypothetical protein